MLIHEVVGVGARDTRLFHAASGEASDYADSPEDVWTVGETAEVDGVEITISERTETGFVLMLYSPDNFDPDFPQGTAVDAPVSDQADQNSVNDTPVLVTSVSGNTGSNGGANTVANSSTGGSGGGAAYMLLWLLTLVFVARSFSQGYVARLS